MPLSNCVPVVWKYEQKLLAKYIELEEQRKELIRTAIMRYLSTLDDKELNMINLSDYDCHLTFITLKFKGYLGWKTVSISDLLLLTHPEKQAVLDYMASLCLDLLV